MSLNKKISENNRNVRTRMAFSADNSLEEVCGKRF